MNSELARVGGFWEHLKHPLDLTTGELKISLRDQKQRLLIQSLFQGAVVAFLASFTRTKALTSAAKTIFALLGLGVAGISFFLLTLALKTQRIYSERNRLLSVQVQNLEETLEKEKKEGAIRHVAEICDQLISFSKESSKCEKMIKLFKDYHLDVNTVFEWHENKQATFLTLASTWNSPVIILKLLELGADPSYKDHEGRNCLHNVLIYSIQDSSLIIDPVLDRFPDLVHVTTTLDGKLYYIWSSVVVLMNHKSW